jgi:hypothetical protein
LRGLKTGDPKLARMERLRDLSSEDISNFCGQCHRTWADVAGGSQGISDLRFQPYRLANSKCYDPDDARISCLACHDPHQEIVRKAAIYDTKCQVCHAGGKPEARSCKVANSGCVACHMPKIELPGSHYSFTDHQIRVAKAGAPYPN